MKKAINLFTLLIIFYPIVMQAQVTQEWVATYNGVGAGFNVPSKCVVDKEGNIIIVGRSEDLSYNDDCVILKYNNTGNLLWGKRYKGLASANDRFRDVVLDDSNNIYVTGETDGGSSGSSFNWIIAKYKPNGDTAWVRIYYGPGGRGDVAFSIAIDKNKNVYVTGYCLISLPNNEDLYTVKYNSDGQLQWVRAYSSTINGPDRANKAVTDDSNNVYTIGYGSIPEGNEIITIKYDSNGNELWNRKFPTLSGDYLRPAIGTVDKFNNIIVNGYYYYEGAQYAFNTLKYNSSGDLLWNRIYKGDGNLNFCFALCTDDSANVYAAGRSTNSVTEADFVTIKYNQFGDTLWIRYYDGGYDNFDEIHSMAVDNFQNVYVTGLTGSPNGLPFYTTINYGKNGIIKWKKEYKGNRLNDIPYCLTLDLNNNVIVSGSTSTSEYNCSIGTIKYSQLTGIIENNNFVKPDYKLYQNYPNPFNPATKLGFVIPDLGFVTLKVFDETGREIKTLVNENKPAGNYEVKFEGSDLSSGIYFYSLSVDGNVVDTKRMVLLK